MNKWNENDVREIFNELDEITGANSKNIPIKINNRLKTTVARYRYWTKDRRPEDFQFGKTIMNVEDKKALRDVAVHEYAHYIINSVRKSDNAGHTPEFRELVRELGSDNVQSTCTDFVERQLKEVRNRIQK